MDIREMDINELIPYENNPRRNEGAVEPVMKSIKEFGFKVPIVIDKDNVVVTGHTRLKAAKRLGLSVVPVIIADDLTEEQIKAFRLADNKTAEYAEWDLSKLDQELKELQEMGFDMGAFDFKLQEDADEDDFDLEEALGSIAYPVTKQGDLWALGDHRLLCGDATKKSSVDKLLDGKPLQLIITDPPYNVDYEGTDGKKIMNDNMSDKQFRNFLIEANKRMYESLELGAPIYIFHADSEGYNFRTAFREAGFKMAQCLIWVKQSLVLGRQDYQWRHEPILYGWREGAAHKWYGDRNKDTVIDEDKLNISKAKKEELIQIIKDMQQKMYGQSSVVYHDKPSLNGDHPTMKPVKLIGKLMHNSSVPGDRVGDYFGGSGSTLMAAEQLKRICFIMDQDPKYCDVIIKRWEDFTGRKAERIG